MAQWSRADRTLHTKIVYYGPAFGGKTTNLETLHRITDPRGKHKLLSIKTSDDRTLFFDLLPFDLGDILGYQVAMKLYTVPGQVRYDTTRQVVLAGADAVVFVADSRSDREKQNRWSVRNLRMNMRTKGVDPATVPVVFQFNKQDVEGVARPETVATWLGVKPDRGHASVATEGPGVLETFMAASTEMLHRLVARADRSVRKKIDVGDLSTHITRAFSPFLARREADAGGSREPDEHRLPFVIDSADTLRESVTTSLRIGEKLASETARAARLEREAEAYRRLSDMLQELGPSFDRAAIVEATLEAAARVLDAGAVSLVDTQGASPQSEHGWKGRPDPLSTVAAGRALLARFGRLNGPCVVDDLATEIPDDHRGQQLRELRAVAAVPLVSPRERVLLAYAPRPDGSFAAADVRFLATLAGHLTVALEKARIHAELERHGERLEQVVASRTGQLREALDRLRHADRMKDRFLANLSHEMKTPLTAILSSAVFLRDYPAPPGERNEMTGSIVMAAETLREQIDRLFDAVGLDEDESRPLELSETTPEMLAYEAVELSGSERVACRVEAAGLPVRLDVPTLARAVANLIDNAEKFSPESCPVELEVDVDHTDPGTGEWLRIAVLDRGDGVREEDRERIFAPFEQGGDSMTEKPRGVGLGLYETRQLVARHHGEVRYRPRDGGGSEFRILVPAGRVTAPVSKEVVGA